MADSLRSKVRKAVNAKDKLNTRIAAGETVQRNAEAAGIKNLTTAEFNKARKTLQPRMRQDRKKTAARAVAIEKMQTKKIAAKRAAAAIGNSPAAKKKVSMAKPTTKKAGKK
jgi:UDP-3-O-[3-hydroxymyristoyl] glucosamine N-acyltransferase